MTVGRVRLPNVGRFTAEIKAVLVSTLGAVSTLVAQRILAALIRRIWPEFERA
jgi:hypothetical protein